MYGRLMVGSAAGIAGLIALAQLAPSASARPRGGEGPVLGPDVIVSNMTEVELKGTIGGIAAYSLATTSCNIGDAPASWIDCTVKLPGCNQHPVISQNLYRLLDGRFEQIGMSWLKHAFCALDEDTCGACQANFDCNYLAVGCADTYTAFTNGIQPFLGPRSEVNPSTGVFPYPFGLGWNQTGNAINKRLQVHLADLDPALNPGARYFAEAQYITTDEQPWGNQANNVGHRELEVTGPSGDGFALAYSQLIQSQSPAIEAWQDANAQVVIETIDVPGDGPIMIGALVTDLGGGQWHYEYAAYNMYSDRGVQRFTVPLEGCLQVSDVSFHDVDYHSGEPYDGTDWPASVSSTAVSWQTSSFDSSTLANALRWGTTYNFRFDASAPPTVQSVEISLFKPGSPSTMLVMLPAPSGPPPPVVPGDCGDFNGTVDILDLLELLAQWGQAGRPTCDLAPGDGDGVVGIEDLLALLAQWGATSDCP